MLTFNTDALLKSLREAHTDAVFKMERMVRGFAYQLTLRAIENTPLGDSDVYARYYNARTNLPKVEGLARGNWQFDKNGSLTLQIIAGQSSGEVALDLVEMASSSYKLGDRFFIGNATPYISALEADHSPLTNGEGIMQPTLTDITGAYSVDFQRLYASG